MVGAGLTAKLDLLSPGKRTLLAAGLIFVLTLLAYSNSFNAGFHFDDTHQILDNRAVRDLDNLPRLFVDAGLASGRAELRGYRPVTMASLVVNHALSGYRVFGYHVFNFSAHFLNSFLVYLVVGLVLARAGRQDEFYVPLVSSVLFAVHPIQTGAVTYISSRSGLLASFFCLLAFYAFAKYRARGPSRALAWAVSAPVLFLLGLLSKETAVCLIGMLAAYDIIFTMPGRGGSRRSYDAWLYYLPFTLVFALFFFYRRALLGYAGGGESDHTVAGYLLSETKALLLYLRLMVLPINQNADYNMPATMSVDGTVVLSAALVSSALGMIYRLRRKNPAAAFFGLWFFVALAPESSIFPIEDITVEYRMYLPSAGLITMLVVMLAGRIKSPSFKRGLAAASIALLGALTFNRNLVWATDYTLWEDVAKKAPYSFRAHANFGAALLDVRQYERAVEELQESLGINEFYNETYVVYNNLGLCYSALGMPEKAEEEYKLAIDIYPREARAFRNLGELYYNTRRYDKAVDPLRQAVMADAGDGLSHFLLAKAYARVGRGMEAEAEMERALLVMPGNFFASYDMAVIYLQNGKRDKALLQARASLPLAPDGPLKRRAEAFVEGMEKGISYSGPVTAGR